MGKTAIKMLVVLILILCIGLIWYKYESNDIQISSAKFTKKQKYYDTKHFSIVTNIGPTYQAKIEIAIPCKDKMQYSDLTHEMVKIKNALLTTLDQEEMTKLIDDRNFDAIKKTYLYVINSFIVNPVDAIYVESFNY